MSSAHSPTSEPPLPSPAIPSTRWAHVAGLTPEEQVERLAGDLELVEVLDRAGYDGPEWDFVAEVLAGYGIGVIRGWLKKGIIQEKCRERNVRFTPLPDGVRLSDDDIDEITDETVARAIHKFQSHVLPNRQWDPRRGASLTTYFIGQCLFQYASALKTWLAANGTHRIVEQPIEPEGLSEIQALWSSLDEAEAGALLARLLGLASSPRAARALEMDLFGYSREEIAHELHATPGSVANLISRERQRLKFAWRRTLEDERHEHGC